MKGGELTLKFDYADINNFSIIIIFWVYKNDGLMLSDAFVVNIILMNFYFTLQFIHTERIIQNIFVGWPDIFIEYFIEFWWSSFDREKMEINDEPLRVYENNAHFYEGWKIVFVFL